MKLLIGIREFREAFAVVGRFVPNKPTSPVYGSVKLAVAGDTAVLSARDQAGGVGVRHEMAALKIEAPGVVLLPKSTVETILKSADEETVAISLDGLKLWIKGKGSRWSVQTGKPEEFADWSGEMTPSFGLMSDDLARLVERTRFATDPLTTKYALGGMLVRWGDGRAMFGAKDGRKIAEAACEARIDGPEDARVQRVIPTGAAEKLVATFPAGSPVDVGFDNGTLIARSGGTSAFARLLEGRFPGHEAVLLKPLDGRMEDIDGKSLRRALDQAAAVMGPSSHAIRFDLTPGLLRLSAVDSESGTSEVEFPAGWDGPAVHTAFQPSFLVPAMKSLGDQPLAITLFEGGNMIGIHAPGCDFYAMAHDVPEARK